MLQLTVLKLKEKAKQLILLCYKIVWLVKFEENENVEVVSSCGRDIQHRQHMSVFWAVMFRMVVTARKHFVTDPREISLEVLIRISSNLFEKSVHYISDY